MDQELKDEFQKINQRFDAIIKNMVTKADLVELRAGLPTRKDFHEMQKSSDKLAGEVIGYRTEQAAVDHRLEKVEDWITKAAPQVGVAFQQ